MTVPGIGAVGFTPFVPPTVPTATTGPVAGSADVQSAAGGSFGRMVLEGVDRLQAAQTTSENLAVKAATGDLTNIHDYTIAASEAATMTQVTMAVRTKALEAYSEIMRMQV